MLGKHDDTKAVRPDNIIQTDASDLNQLGYKQELKRDFSLFGIVAFSFSIVTSWTALSGVMIIGVQVYRHPYHLRAAY